MLNSNVVNGVGDPGSPVWFIGEAPGYHENRERTPFVGQSGQLLNKALGEAGIVRKSLYINNIFNQRPPGNNVQYFYSGKETLTEEGRVHLEKLINLIHFYEPRLIVCLGGTALFHLAGKDKITKYRGSLYPCIYEKETKVYGTYHPSAVLRSMQEKDSSEGNDRGLVNAYVTFVHDLKRVSWLSRQNKFPNPQVETVRPTSPIEIKDFCKDIINSVIQIRRNSKPLISADIETIPVEGQSPIFTRIGIGMNSETAISIPITNNATAAWSKEEFDEILTYISYLFSKCKVIWHNSLYDLLHLFNQFQIVCPDIEDTMILSHCMHPYTARSLAHLSSIYTWIPYHKGMVKDWFSISPIVLSQYNGLDCCATYEIYLALEQEMEKDHYFEKGYRRTISYIPSILSMMLKGIKVDTDKMKKLEESYVKDREEAYSKIKKYTNGKELNINSPKQMKEFLYKTLSLPEQYKKGKLTTDVDALNKLDVVTKHPVISAIKTWRAKSKMSTTYTSMKTLKDKKGNDRCYTSYDPGKAITWRLTSSKSTLGLNAGMNLQNQPKGKDASFRGIFVADEGKVLIASDLPQAEDRYVVWKAGAEEHIEMYLSGKDMHWENAKNIASFRGISLPDEYDKSHEESYLWRNKLAKHCKHASNYGMKMYRFQQMLFKAGMTQYSATDAKNLLEAQALSAPYISEWHKWVRARVSSGDRSLITPMGRKRVFVGRIDENFYKAAYAFEPQSTIGELVVDSISNIFSKYASDPGFDLLLNVHDEVVCQVDEARVPEFAKKIKEEMTRTIELEDIRGKKRKLTLEGDIAVGKSWAELKEIDKEEIERW